MKFKATSQPRTQTPQHACKLKLKAAQHAIRVVDPQGDDALEVSAARMGYKIMRLETGSRQLPAMALYESFDFERIAPFGEYVNDPTSVCCEKRIAQRAGA